VAREDHLRGADHLLARRELDMLRIERREPGRGGVRPVRHCGGLRRRSRGLLRRHQEAAAPEQERHGGELHWANERRETIRAMHGADGLHWVVGGSIPNATSASRLAQKTDGLAATEARSDSARRCAAP
jgi:hypothetical protein